MSLLMFHQTYQQLTPLKSLATLNVVFSISFRKVGKVQVVERSPILHVLNPKTTKFLPDSLKLMTRFSQDTISKRQCDCVFIYRHQSETFFFKILKNDSILPCYFFQRLAVTVYLLLPINLHIKLFKF